MDVLVLWIIAFTAVGGVVSVLAAAGVLLLSATTLARALPSLVSFAIGALLGAALLNLLPEALEANPGGAAPVTLTLLAGLLGFFLLEKMVIWRHCHADDCEVHGHADAPVFNIDDARAAAAGKLILIGDGIHNFVDGVLIAAAFLADIKVGVVTGIAVVAHEIPQELGDFIVLLNSGYSRARALLYNVLSGLTTIVGGVIAYFSLSLAHALVPYVLAIAASSFLYIAVADLIPGLHRRPEFSATLHQALLIACGVGVIVIVQAIVH